MSTVNVGNPSTAPVQSAIVSALPTGANTIGNVNIGTTGGLALDTSVAGLSLAIASTTSGQKGVLHMGAVTTNAPTYTTAQTDPISLDTAGLLRVTLKDTPANTNNLNVALAASSATVTVTATNLPTNIAQVNGATVATAASGIAKVGVTDGTGNAIGSTGGGLNVAIISGAGGTVADETAWTAGSSIFVGTGGVFNDSATALTSGQEGTFRSTNNRALHVNLRDASANQLLGIKTSANSLPVVIASDQAALDISPGGKTTTSIAAAATNTVVKASPGRLCRVMVTTPGTVALIFYNNATGGSTTGDILGYIPANAAAGSVYDFQFAATVGIQAPGGANTPAVTVGYN
jgi:hypothetical protein